jgi:hypothetical protein
MDSTIDKQILLTFYQDHLKTRPSFRCTGGGDVAIARAFSLPCSCNFLGRRVRGFRGGGLPAVAYPA